VIGQDTLGRFEVSCTGSLITCECCSADVTVGVWYLEPRPDVTGLTVLGNPPDPERTIGVTCGCYAKLHRQLAHIKHGMQVWP
jgi:hypothetical protein